MTCDYGLSRKPAEDFLEEAKSFYYDLALSANEHTLGLLLGFARRERVLFGTDFPYAPVKTTETNTKGLEGYELEVGWRYGIARGNALALFPRLVAAGIDGGEGGRMMEAFGEREKGKRKKGREVDVDVDDVARRSCVVM